MSVRAKNTCGSGGTNPLLLNRCSTATAGQYPHVLWQFLRLTVRASAISLKHTHTHTHTHTLIFDSQKAVTHMHEISCCLALHAMLRLNTVAAGHSTNHTQPSRGVVIVNILSIPMNYDLLTNSDHQCTQLYCNPNNKTLSTVNCAACVPGCHVCGHCRHRCSYLGYLATVEIPRDRGVL